MKATKPPTTRAGRTHKIMVGKVRCYITVNKDAEGRILEVFAKADSGQQGAMDMVCRMASLALQGRGSVETIIKHMANDRTPPNGGPGQPSSCFDAISQILQRELNA